MMSGDVPDERHDFTAWAVERFGERYFVEWHDFRSFGGPSGRAEISEADYRAVLAGDVRPGKLIRKHDDHALTRGLENPGPVVKVFLLATFVLFAATLVALLAGWV